MRARQIEIDRSFAIFWAAYPKKVDKQDVQAAWRRLAPSADLAAEIMAGLERWKTCDRWRHGGTEFVIDPIRFLKRRRWESDPPTTAEHPGPVAPPRTAAETTMANLRAVAAEKGIAR